MRRRRWLLPVLLVSPLAAQPATAQPAPAPATAQPAAAQPATGQPAPQQAAANPVAARLGTHDGFGRVVLEFQQSPAFTTERQDNALLLHFPSGPEIPDIPGKARNIAAVTGGNGLATVTVRPGARPRVSRLGNRVVVDILDPAPTKPAAAHAPPAPGKASPPAVPAPSTSAAAPAPSTPAAADPARPAAVPATAAIVAPERSAPRPAPSVPQPAAPEPQLAQGQAPLQPRAQPLLPAAPLPSPAATPPPTLALAATPVAAPNGASSGAAVLPFGPGVAAASFRHGEEAWVVFDEKRPIDLAALGGDPAFADASVDNLPAATLLRLKLPPSRSVKLVREAEGWSVAVTAGQAADPAVMPAVNASQLLFPAAAPGKVVTVPNTETGRNLLVGTVRSTGPGVPVALRMPEFVVYPSWQGVLVEPVSDRVAFRAVPDGFALATGGPLSTALDQGPAPADAAVLTRRFDLPAEPVPTLLRRLQVEVQDEGQAPAQARLATRKAAAQTMLALGLGPEALALLRLAVTEDPRAAKDADVNGLTGMAALLSFRPEEADGLDALALDGSDEITLWRALRSVALSGASPQTAQALSTTAGLLLAYPTALRNRFLPVAAEALVEGGAPKAADALFAALPREPSLVFALALRMEQKGDTASALTAYDALSAGRDRSLSARAATRATYLRLATGALSPEQAAKTLEQSFGDWRGDARERDLRLRTAAIFGQAGQWRKAFAILKDTAQLFPDAAKDISVRMTAMIGEIVHGPAADSIKPLDFVALTEENAGTIAKDDASGVALLIADKLTALDLPERAGPVIEGMLAAMPAGNERAALGARLADLRLSEQNASGAASALASTDTPDLPVAIRNERLMTDARIHAMMHDQAGATALLAELATPAADEQRASILAEGGDWHGAALALQSAILDRLPADGSLSPQQQDDVLRLASAQSRAGDEAALQGLSAKAGSRMTGPRADMFRLLTSAPVAGVADLRRVSGEVALARALPTNLAAIGKR